MDWSVWYKEDDKKNFLLHAYVCTTTNLFRWGNICAITQLWRLPGEQSCPLLVKGCITTLLQTVKTVINMALSPMSYFESTTLRLHNIANNCAKVIFAKCANVLPYINSKHNCVRVLHVTNIYRDIPVFYLLLFSWRREAHKQTHRSVVFSYKKLNVNS